MENKNISRRQLITVAAGSVVAGGLLGAGGMSLAQNQGGASTPSKHPSLPWKYVKLDPDLVAKRGYEYYFSKGG